jgi:hypothetical protein
MSRVRVLAAGRRAAEAGMIDTCRITRRTSTLTDETTGKPAGGTIGEIYTGKCRIQRAESQGQRQEVAEASLVLLRLELQLPVDASLGLQEADDVEVLTCVHDPDMTARRFKVRDLAHKSEATARRIQCLEVTS